MTRRLIVTALLAGALAGLCVTLAQGLGTSPLIRAAEVFETATPASHAVHAAADLATAESDAADSLATRTLLTLGANLVVGVGFGLLLVAGFALAGRPVGAATGLVWGIGGFLAFALAPALGLPPELPGMPAAELAARQVWWLLTVAATAGGLGLLVFAPANWAWRVGALALLLLPHLVGAPPPPHDAASAVPAELAARFAVASLATSALFWTVLGTAAGHFWRREAGAPS